MNHQLPPNTKSGYGHHTSDQIIKRKRDLVPVIKDFDLEYKY